MKPITTPAALMKPANLTENTAAIQMNTITSIVNEYMPLNHEITTHINITPASNIISTLKTTACDAPISIGAAIMLLETQ